MSEKDLIDRMRLAIDDELQSCIENHFGEDSGFKAILEYQLGLDGKTGNHSSGGKRLRPLMTLLVCHALGGNWKEALPAAAAVELIHNFSLVHDDIEDQSQTRRGKDTIWVKWSVAQAINAGDGLLALASLELSNLQIPETQLLEAMESLHRATFTLTTGQYLDMAYEKAESISMDEYLDMVNAKTGALFADCFELGALTAGITSDRLNGYTETGRKIGLAFQVQDDYLGIWGKPEETGKSNDNDIMNRKKSFPILYALVYFPKIRHKWISTPEFTLEEADQFKDMLTDVGVQVETRQKIEKYYESASIGLKECFPDEEKSLPLESLVKDLLFRVN